jgi:hypothetical protein
MFGVLQRDPAYLSGLNRFELFPRNIMFVETRVINSPKESTPNAANMPIKILARLRKNLFLRSSIITVFGPALNPPPRTATHNQMIRRISSASFQRAATNYLPSPLVRAVAQGIERTNYSD